MNILAAIFLAATFAQAPAVEVTLPMLEEQFSNLYQSLRATGGMSDADKPVLDQLRQRLVEFNRSNPDNLTAIAMELQLSEWLDDADRVNTLFGELVRATDDIEYGLAWAAWAQRRGDRQRVGEIYSRLGRQFPDDPAVKLGWARFLKGINRYDTALEILQSAGFDPAQDPKAVVELSDCLFAEQQYEASIAALESIPQEVQSANPAIASQVEQMLNQRRPYLELWTREQEIRAAEASAGDLPRVRIITSRGPIVVELFENEAPNTVANFVSLADSGFYEGTRFHRVIPNFMAQGGDPNSRPDAEGVPGQGSPGYRIADEHDRDDARNHFTGSLAMAKQDPPHTAGCQFYVTHLPTPHLNGKHTVFGRVTDGLDVARAIEVDDVIEEVVVLSRRDHPYTPETLPEQPAPTEPAPIDALGTISKPLPTQPDLGATRKE